MDKATKLQTIYTASRKIPSFFANRMISKVTGVKLHDYGCSLKAYRAEVLKRVELYGELHRFIPVLVSMEGGSIAELPVAHSPRVLGKSKYGISRTYRVLMDLLTVTFLKQYGDRPQHAFGIFGVLLLGTGLLEDLYVPKATAGRVGPKQARVAVLYPHRRL